MERKQNHGVKVVAAFFTRLHWVLILLCGLVSPAGFGQTANINGLSAAVASEFRDPANVARDRYRHPLETLAFFGVSPESKVVEIWPGKGWYSEILAPYLASRGTFYAAHFPADTEVAFFNRARANYAQLLEERPELYSSTLLTEFYPPGSVYAAPAGTVDFVLTFRNVHNWMKAGYEQAAFTQFFDLLKPGGVLGVVEHRADPGTSEALMVASGYVTEKRVIELAQRAGFVLEESSEINANPEDSKNYPSGVWSLPPTLRLGEASRAYYLAIGESDRMTLKFRKPR